MKKMVLLGNDMSSTGKQTNNTKDVESKIP